MCDEENGEKEADPNEDWNCGSSTHTARFAPDVLEMGRMKLGFRDVESKCRHGEGIQHAACQQVSATAVFRVSLILKILTVR